MSIKKSVLEEKLLYRIAKIFFLILPLLALAIMFLEGYIIIPEITQNNIGYIFQKNIIYIVYIIGGLILYYLFLNLIWKGVLYIIFGGLENDTSKPIVGIAQPVNLVARPVQPSNQAGSVIGFVFLIILIMIIVNYSDDGSSIFSNKHTYGTSCSANGEKGLYGTNGNCYTCSSNSVAVTSPVNNCSDGVAGVYCCNNAGGNNGGSGGSKCIPTGCGTLWNCWGDYYPASGVRTHISGCFTTNQSSLPSWSGTCRRCP